MLIANSVGAFSDNIFEGNVSLQSGGGLVAFENSTATLSGNEFINNMAMFGGAFIAIDAVINLSDPDDNTYSNNLPEDLPDELTEEEIREQLEERIEDTVEDLEEETEDEEQEETEQNGLE